MYKSLNDAAKVANILSEGDYKIYYVGGYDHQDPYIENDYNKAIRNLKFPLSSDKDLYLSKEYHNLLGSIKGSSDLEDIFMIMQGENWSPNGEARNLITSKGLDHTSMSVGDMIETPEGDLYIVASFGFDKIN